MAPLPPSHTPPRAAGALPPLSRPALVLGSGPNSRPPPAPMSDWSLLTVNGSQTIAAKWGLETPDLTVFGTGVLRHRIASREAKRVLRGSGTRFLVLMTDPGMRLTQTLRLLFLRYRYERRVFMPPAERAEIIAAVIGEGSRTIKPSNGIFLALLALHLGAPKAVMSGFSLTSGGHAYSELNLKRAHIDADHAALAEAARRQLPLFTNDPVFAAESGLPLIGNVQA